MVPLHSASRGPLRISAARVCRTAQALAVVALWMLASVSGAAEPAGKPAALDDLKPAYATAADINEGKLAADGMCARCHGANGISSSKGVPHVAGTSGSKSGLWKPSASRRYSPLALEIP